VDELPIATRQLIAIARAIATSARMVIMDEPTTSLTQKEVDALVKVINGLRANGVAVLFVSHKLDECFAIGGQAIVFRDGEKVAQGPIQGFTKAQLGQLMTGKQLSQERHRVDAQLQKTRLEVTALTRRAAFEDVTSRCMKARSWASPACSIRAAMNWPWRWPGWNRRMPDRSCWTDSRYRCARPAMPSPTASATCPRIASAKACSWTNRFATTSSPPSCARCAASSAH
jgi:hypothetical protein